MCRSKTKSGAPGPLFKQFLSLSLSSLLILQSLPLQAGNQLKLSSQTRKKPTQELEPELNNNKAKALHNLNIVFDGSSSNGATGQSAPVLLLASAQGDLERAKEQACRAAGINCDNSTTPPPQPGQCTGCSQPGSTSVPGPTVSGPESPCIPSASGPCSNRPERPNNQDNSSSNPTGGQNPGWGRATETDRQNYQRYRQEQALSPNPQNSANNPPQNQNNGPSQRDLSYEGLSGFGKFGYWLSNILALPAPIAGGALLGLALGGPAWAIGLGVAGLLLGAFLLAASVQNPGPFHEIVTLAIIVPPIFIFEALLTIFSLGHLSLIKTDSGDKSWRAVSLATQAVILAGGASLGLGALGVPILAGAAALMPVPLALGIGAFAVGSTAYRGMRFIADKISENRDQREQERQKQEQEQAQERQKQQQQGQLEDLLQKNEAIRVQANAVFQAVNALPRTPGETKALEDYRDSLPKSRKIDWNTASLPEKILNRQEAIRFNELWSQKLEEFRKTKTQQIESIEKGQIVQDMGHLYRENITPLDSFYQVLPEAKTVHQNLVSVTEAMGIPGSLTKDQLLAYKAQLQEQIAVLNNAYRNFQQSKRQSYLHNEGLNEEQDAQRNETVKFLKDNHGNNFWQSSVILHPLELSEQDRQALRSLDLGYEIAYGPFDPKGRPMMGALYETGANGDPTDTVIAPELPVVIPSRTLHIVQSPGHNLRDYDTSNASGAQHKAVDIACDWSQRRDGLGVPIGMQHTMEVIYVGKEHSRPNADYGNHVVLRDLESPGDYWLIGHGGNPGEAGSGILVKPGEIISPYHPIMLLGLSGGANMAGPKDPNSPDNIERTRGTPLAHVHVEKIVVDGKTEKLINEKLLKIQQLKERDPGPLNNKEHLKIEWQIKAVRQEIKKDRLDIHSKGHKRNVDWLKEYELKEHESK